MDLVSRDLYVEVLSDSFLGLAPSSLLNSSVTILDIASLIPSHGLINDSANCPWNLDPSSIGACGLN